VAIVKLLKASNSTLRETRVALLKDEMPSDLYEMLVRTLSYTIKR